jgi:hypothetical protein
VRAFDRAPVHLAYNGHHSPIMAGQLEELRVRVGLVRKLSMPLSAFTIKNLGFGAVEGEGCFDSLSCKSSPLRKSVLFMIMVDRCWISFTFRRPEFILDGSSCTSRRT